MTYYEIVGHYGHYPEISGILFFLCPSSIMSMALESASRKEIIEVWLMIVTVNAILYGMVGAVVGAAIHMTRRKSSQS
jgi:hypothetical protein